MKASLQEKCNNLDALINGVKDADGDYKLLITNYNDLIEELRTDNSSRSRADEEQLRTVISKCLRTLPADIVAGTK